MERIYPKVMPEQSYLIGKQHKKKTAIAGGWMLIAFGVIFMAVIIKFATSGGSSAILSFRTFPAGDDAYQIAKEYVGPTIKERNIVFADRYQFAKKSDSVFVIRFYVTSIDENGGKTKTNFQITLKYNGGPKAVQDNWTMVDMKENHD